MNNLVIASPSYEHTGVDRLRFTERGGTGGFLQAFGSDRDEATLTDLTQDLAAKV